MVVSSNGPIRHLYLGKNHPYCLPTSHSFLLGPLIISWNLHYGIRHIVGLADSYCIFPCNLHTARQTEVWRPKSIYYEPADMQLTSYTFPGFFCCTCSSVMQCFHRIIRPTYSDSSSAKLHTKFTIKNAKNAQFLVAWTPHPGSGPPPDLISSKSAPGSGHEY